MGWRLTLERKPDGAAISVWHCPACWQKRRSARLPKDRT
jgi:hypothetical protein